MRYRISLRVRPKRPLPKYGRDSKVKHPFDHIGRELTDLQGKSEVVSNDVLLLKGAIKQERQTLSDKVDSAQNIVLEKVENLFDRRFWQTAGAIVGCLAITFGIVTLLRDHGVTGTALGWVSVAGGLGIFVAIYLLSRRPSTKPSTLPKIPN